jgi:hypothetical protein
MQTTPYEKGVTFAKVVDNETLFTTLPGTIQCADPENNTIIKKALYLSIKEIILDPIDDIIREKGMYPTLLVHDGENVTNEFKVNLLAARNRASELRDAIDSAPDRLLLTAMHGRTFTVVRCMRYLATNIKVFRAIRAGHPVQGRYERKQAGRYYARKRKEDTNDYIDFQSMPTTVRKAFLSNLGYFDIDQDTSHHSNLLGLAQTLLGEDATVLYPTLTEYVRDKHTIRSRIAQNADLSIDAAKTIVTSKLYGARFAIDGGIGDILLDEGLSRDQASERLERLKNDPILRQLHNETRNIEKKLLEWAYRSASKLGYIRLPHGDELLAVMKTKNQLYSNINMSAESLVLDVCVDLLGDSIIILQHDGFTVKRDIDHVELGRKVSETLEYEVTFSKEEL